MGCLIQVISGCSNWIIVAIANTPNGAKASAILFSLIETAKEYAIDPYDYLVWVLKKAPELVENKELDKVAELTPDNYRRQGKGD